MVHYRAEVAQLVVYSLAQYLKYFKPARWKIFAAWQQSESAWIFLQESESEWRKSGKKVKSRKNASSERIGEKNRQKTVIKHLLAQMQHRGEADLRKLRIPQRFNFLITWNETISL